MGDSSMNDDGQPRGGISGSDEAPRLMDRYRLGPVLGRGGMATVHIGHDTLLDRSVAIKLLAPHLAASAEYRERLLSEARCAAQLNHPHIVRIYDAGSTPFPGAAAPMGPETVALVMELVEGESLQEWLARRTPTVAEAVTVATQVADALSYAHAQGIIHRDIKPHNLLLAGQSVPLLPPAAAGTTGIVNAGGALTDSDVTTMLARNAASEPLWVKLADFGLARSVEATTVYTATGLVMGSAPYLAPELIEGAPATAASDLYALGVTLFQMLAGRYPFEGATSAASLAVRLTQEAPPVRVFRPGVPIWLDELVAQLLARDPALRLADAAQLAERLRVPHGATTQTLVPVPRVARTAPPPPGKRQTLSESTYTVPRVARTAPPPTATAPRRLGAVGRRRLVSLAGVSLGVVVAIGIATGLPAALHSGQAQGMGDATSAEGAVPTVLAGTPTVAATPIPATPVAAPTATAGSGPLPTPIVVRLR